MPSLINPISKSIFRSDGHLVMSQALGIADAARRGCVSVYGRSILAFVLPNIAFAALSLCLCFPHAATIAMFSQCTTTTFMLHKF